MPLKMSLMDDCIRSTLGKTDSLGVHWQMRKRQFHLSLQVNTDGVAVFRSSKFSIWPVYFIVNELPPNCRYIYIPLNLYTYTHLFTAYSACDTHANVLMGMQYFTYGVWPLVPMKNMQTCISYLRRRVLC